MLDLALLGPHNVPGPSVSDKTPNLFFQAQLQPKSKCLQIWQDVRPNFFVFGYILSSNACGFDKMSYLTFLGLVTRQARVPLDLEGCQTQYPWVQDRPNPKHKIGEPRVIISLCSNFVKFLKKSDVSININIDYKG